MTTVRVAAIADLHDREQQRNDNDCRNGARDDQTEVLWKGRDERGSNIADKWRRQNDHNAGDDGSRQATAMEPGRNSHG